MTLRIVRALITVVAITLLTVGLNPTPALADDAARISYLELEIQRLRSRVDEQQRRILRLEEELNRRADSGVAAPRPPKPVAEGTGVNPSATAPLPWHAKESWARVAKGMSETEVTEILGPPTTVESVGAYKTLFYRGPVAGAGSLSGIVNFKDGRVVAVNAPDF